MKLVVYSCVLQMHTNALIPFAIAMYLSLEEQSIWASQTRVFPSSELPACPGGHTEDWSAVDAQSGNPSEEPSVHTAELDTSTKNHLWCHFLHWADIIEQTQINAPEIVTVVGYLRTTSITLCRRKVRLLCRLPKRLMSSGHTLAVG